MENIQENKDLLLEDTTGANAPNIATTDENLSAEQMFQQSALPSLGRQIFSVVPMNGPTAALFNIRKKDESAGDDGDGVPEFELVRNEVAVYATTAIHTGVTKEVIQDLYSQYGKEAEQVVGTLLRGLANDQENTRTMAFLNAQSKSIADLQLTDSLSAETNIFEITQKVHETVLLMNGKNLRTFKAFCVLPYYAGAAVASLNSYVGGEDKDERGLFLAEIGQTKFYMNPDVTSTKAYVGLKDVNPSKSSAVFSPYRSNVVESQNPSTGDTSYHLYNRFAITASPLHVTDNEMLYTFNILV